MEVETASRNQQQFRKRMSGEGLSPDCEQEAQNFLVSVQLSNYSDKNSGMVFLWFT